MLYLVSTAFWVAARVSELYEKLEEHFISWGEASLYNKEPEPTNDVSIMSSTSTSDPTGLGAHPDTDSGYESVSSPSEEEQKEAFPAFPVFEDVAEEIEAMNDYHGFTGLLLQRPVFVPDLTRIDAKKVNRVPIAWNKDIIFHQDEARIALGTALHYATCTDESRNKTTDPAFTDPAKAEKVFSSPFVGEMTRYLRKTHVGDDNAIRVVTPSTLRSELLTCLSFAFMNYVTSESFRKNFDPRAENTFVPELIAPLIEEARDGDLPQFQVAMDCCMNGFVDGGEFLEIWQAWLYVIKYFVGLLVLRDRARKKEDISWI